MAFSLNDLNKLDIKEILKKKDILIYIGIVVVALLLSAQIYKSQRNRIKNMRDQVAAEQERIALGKELFNVENEISQVSSPYFKKGEGLDTNIFQQFASEANVNIVSVSPQGERDDRFDTVALFSLTLEATYHTLGKFISILESHKDILQIESSTVKRAEGKAEEASVAFFDGENNLIVEMVVGATFIKAQ